MAATLVGGGIQAVLLLPDLHQWHRVVPDAEVRAAEMEESFTLAQYLEREDEVFRQVRDRVEAPTSMAAGAGSVANRYDLASRSSPQHAARDWNRTVELTPPVVQGGALLVHGLTDSPYSMRSTAQMLNEHGFHVLALRVPGHGTVPAALTQVTAEDWMAAVRRSGRAACRTISRRADEGRDCRRARQVGRTAEGTPHRG